MNKLLATYKFGSKVCGYDTPQSDTDAGEIRYYGLKSFISLNPSKQNTPKNSTQKTKEGDLEILDYANFLQQVFKPSPNLHAKIMTLESQNPSFWVDDYRYVIDQYIYWRDYIYKCVAFADNLKDTSKGLVQGMYTLSLVLEQLIQNKYTIDPKWWVFDGSTLIYKCVLDRKTLRDSDDEESFVAWWGTQLEMLKNILLHSPEMNNTDIYYLTRESALLEYFEQFICRENLPIG